MSLEFDSLLRFNRYRYLWWAVILVTASVVIFLLPTENQPRSGGTWQGYTLGTVGALLIVWLALLGIRKRRYSSSTGTVQGWVSAHVYLGTTLLVVATLHAAGQFGWNVHTFAYVLMCIVIFSGFYGVYAYLSHPRRLSSNRAGAQREKLFAELYELNDQGRRLSESCEPEVLRAVQSSIERTAIGGGVLTQLFERDGSQFVAEGSRPTANRDQQAIIDYIARRIPRAEKREEVVSLEDLLSVMSRRQTVLRRLRRDISLSGWVKLWLYFHVPVTGALLIALIIHIVTTFIYW